jgi:signal transduction histidine kinase
MTENFPLMSWMGSISAGVRRASVLRELDGLRLEVAALQASRMRLALATDAERRVLERALHDGVQQQLVGLAANIDLVAGSIEADPAEAQRLLKEVRRDLQHALEETRTLADRIHPPLLEAGGLGVALRSAAAGADVPIRIDISIAEACPVEIAGVVYFCCLDVLERAAARTPVTVTVWDEEGTLAFEVIADCDVGVALPSRDRVEALGGRLTIRVGPDQTHMVGSLPLSEPG